MTSGDDELDLREAADRLGVHYQTAYRWVRSGQLPSRLVGGRYLVSASDLETLRRRREAPAKPSAPRRKRVEHQAERIHDALLSGDEASVRSIARTLVEEGSTVVEVVQVVLVPALRRMGQAWHDGDLTVGVEHRASSIVERTLGELAPNPRGRRRGTAMVAAVSDDRHSLPTIMAAVALRESNWRVHHLGADMPPDELLRFCREHDIDLAVISVTNPNVSAVAESTADQISATGTRVILGAPGRTLAELVAEANGGGATRR